MKQKIMLCASFCMALLGMNLSSCTQEENTGNTAKLRIFPTLENPTRAIMNNFVNGNQIGLFVMAADGGNYNDCDCGFNAMASLNASVWTVNQNIELTSAKADIYAYYPYKAGLNSTTIPVEVASQTDYLFATKTTADVNNPTATIPMKHALALNSFVLKKGSYSGIGKVTKIELKNTKTEGTLDVKTGEVIVGNTKASMSAECNVVLNDNVQKISAIMMPVTITESDNITARFTIDGEVYSYEISPTTWAPGNENIYTLGIKEDTKKLFEIGSVEINPWGVGAQYDGNLTNDKFDVDVDIE